MPRQRSLTGEPAFAPVDGELNGRHVAVLLDDFYIALGLDGVSELEFVPEPGSVASSFVLLGALLVALLVSWALGVRWP